MNGEGEISHTTHLHLRASAAFIPASNQSSRRQCSVPLLTDAS